MGVAALGGPQSPRVRPPVDIRVIGKVDTVAAVFVDQNPASTDPDFVIQRVYGTLGAVRPVPVWRDRVVTTARRREDSIGENKIHRGHAQVAVMRRAIKDVIFEPCELVFKVGRIVGVKPISVDMRVVDDASEPKGKDLDGVWPYPTQASLEIGTRARPSQPGEVHDGQWAGDGEPAWAGGARIVRGDPAKWVGAIGFRKR